MFLLSVDSYKGFRESFCGLTGKLLRLPDCVESTLVGDAWRVILCDPPLLVLFWGPLNSGRDKTEYVSPGVKCEQHEAEEYKSPFLSPNEKPGSFVHWKMIVSYRVLHLFERVDHSFPLGIVLRESFEPSWEISLGRHQRPLERV